MNRMFETASYYVVSLIVAISAGFAAFAILTIAGHREFYGSINREIVWIPLGFLAGAVAVYLRGRAKAALSNRNYAA